MQERAGKAEVAQYDEVPKKLRNQIWFILTDGIIGLHEVEASRKKIHNDLAREIGVFYLYEAVGGDIHIPAFNSYFEICKFFLLETTLAHVWELVELCFCFLENKRQ